MALETRCMAHQGEQSEGLCKKRRQDPGESMWGKVGYRFPGLAMPAPVWGRSLGYQPGNHHGMVFRFSRHVHGHAHSIIQ